VSALLLSLGEHLPGFGAMGFLHIFRFPANWLLLATAAASLLAALGVARIRKPSRQWVAAVLVLADLLVFLAIPRAAWSRPEFLSDAPALAGARRGRIYHTDELRRAWEKGTLETEEDYLLMRDFLAPSYGAAFGAREASSYQTLRLRRADDYLRRMTPERADWAGVDRVVGLKRGASRVTRETIEVSLRKTARERLFLAGAGTIREAAARPGFASARVRTASGGQAVLSEMIYPGWTARVDGSPVEIGLLAEAFPSVEVPSGEHQVEFMFRSNAALLGLAVSLLSVAAYLLAVARHRGQRSASG